MPKALLKFARWATDRAPAIVLVSLGVALICAWTRFVPSILLYVLAALIGLAGAAVLAFGKRDDFKSKEELGFARNRDMIFYDLSLKGIPDGAWGLGLACFVSTLLSGFWSPAIAIVMASALLAGAWALATRRWPADRHPQP